MAKHVIKLSDATGASFRIRLSLPFLQNGTDPNNSSWKVMDEGFLKFRSGGCHAVDTTPGAIFTDGNLLLCVGQYHGVNLNEFLDTVGLTNNSGAGIVYQPWVVTFKPGRITWALDY